IGEKLQISSKQAGRFFGSASGVLRLAAEETRSGVEQQSNNSRTTLEHESNSSRSGVEAFPKQSRSRLEQLSNKCRRTVEENEVRPYFLGTNFILPVVFGIGYRPCSSCWIASAM